MLYSSSNFSSTEKIGAAHRRFPALPHQNGVGRRFKLSGWVKLLPAATSMGSPAIADTTARLTRVEETLRCPICFDFAVEAVETGCCHQVFCAHHAQPGDCTYCRSPGVVYNPNVVAQRVLDSFPIDCPDGCDTPGLTIGRLPGHRGVCGLVAHTCSAVSCTWAGERRAFAAHLAERHAKALFTRAGLLFAPSAAGAGEAASSDHRDSSPDSDEDRDADDESLAGHSTLAGGLTGCIGAVTSWLQDRAVTPQHVGPACLIAGFFVVMAIRTFSLPLRNRR